MPILDPLFEELSDGICVSDSRGYLLYLNEAARKLLDIKGALPRVRLCELLCARFSEASGHSAQTCPLREPGSPEPAVAFLGRYGQKGTDLRVRCLRISTPLFDSWEAEKRLTLIEDATAEMELERHKEDWRSMVIHDLRNPLTNIYGTLKVLAELPLGHALEEHDLMLIQIGTRACKSMAELLDLFLDLPQLEAGVMPINPENVNLTDLVSACVEEQTPAASSRRLRLRCSLPEGASARADRGLLYRVVQNLLNNAMKYTPGGGEIFLSADVEKGSARLTVRDTGPGIAPQDRPHIFDRFYQARGRREGRVAGHGLGLNFCREAVRAMGGDLKVGDCDTGSEFVLTLPGPVWPGAAQ